MAIFSSTKKKNEMILVFHIGSSFVGGSLFWAEGSQTPRIILSEKELIPLKKKIDPERFLFLTIQTLEVVAEKIYKAGMGAPSKVFCVFSSPWHVSETRVISLKKNSPFLFTEKLADELIQKEIKLFEEEFLLKYNSFGNSVRAIELKNIKTTLNGYESESPLNQKVKELEMTVFISVCGEKLLKKIEDTIGKFFHINTIKYISFAIASFSLVRDMYPKQENFLLVDISGETTDVYMVKKNTLRESISFPLGRNFITRGVALNIGCTLNEASSLISLFQDKHAEESVAKKLEHVMNELGIEWLKKFQESLANISNDISIPATVYLAASKDLANFFIETIKTEQFSQYTLTESKFEVIFLSSELLAGLAKFNEQTIREPFLIIDSIYINRFLIKK